MYRACRFPCASAASSACFLAFDLLPPGGAGAFRAERKDLSGMVAKVGQGQQALPVSSSSRLAGGYPVSSAQSFSQVASLQQGRGVGPEDESLHFADTWDDLQGRQPAQQESDGAGRWSGVHFGGVLTTSAVSGFLVSWRSRNDVQMQKVSTKDGAFFYDAVVKVLSSGGVQRQVGANYSRLF